MLFGLVVGVAVGEDVTHAITGDDIADGVVSGVYESSGAPLTRVTALCTRWRR
jgi:hypothetical protein